MKDEMNRNPMTVAGSPPLVAGALSIDTDQALAFDGSTDSASAADSASLSITGALTIEFWLKLASIPGSTKTIFAKAGSYTIQVNSSGKLLFVVENGASTVTVTSLATLTAGVWYHVACVYNDGYAGAEQFGKTTQGASTTPVIGDYYQGSPTNADNKQVTSFTLQEAALIDAVWMDLLRIDATLNQTIRAVIYADSAGSPGALVAQSADRYFAYPAPTRAWYEFPLSAVLSPGTYWLGYMAGESSGSVSIGRETSGGSTKKRNDAMSDGASDPFGTVTTSTAEILACYATYSALARTGLEGKAAIYLDGALDQSAAYTAGIADTANAFQHATTDAPATVDELSIWNRVLTAVEIANHFLAR